MSLRLRQDGAPVAAASGRGRLTASGPITGGTLNVRLTSKSCRTKFRLRIVNTPAPAPPQSVVDMPQGDLPGWRAVFDETFDTDAPLGSFLAAYPNFNAYPYGWTDTSRQVRPNPGHYHPGKTLSVNGGALDAWLHYDHSLGQYLVSAPMPRLPEMTYGRFAMRLRADRIDGYKIAPLLWPDTDVWPDDGEIDFPEGDLDGTPLSGFHHFARAAGGQAAFNTHVNPTDWHVYETAWTPGKVEFFVDGASIGHSTQNVPSKSMHWVLQMETEISTTAPPTTSEGHVHVDWVTVYGRAS